MTALAGALPGCGPGSGAPPSLPSIPAGAPPVLRGVQAIAGVEWMDPMSNQWQRVDYLRYAGVNVVRIFVQPFSVGDGSPLTPGGPLAARLTESLKQWGGLIEWCLEHDIYVMFAVPLEIGYPRYGLWPDDGRSLWKSASAQDEFVAAWVALAIRYAGRRGLLFDLINEPHGVSADEIEGNHALPKQAWSTLYQRTLRAIRRVDPERWVVVEPVWGDPANFVDLQTTTDTRVIYSFHYYTPHAFSFQAAGGAWPAADSVHYPGVARDELWMQPRYWDAAAIRADMQPAFDFARTVDAPVMLGEFGVARGAPPEERARWVRDVLSIIEPAGFGMLYFQYEGWGVPEDFRLGWTFENSPVEVPMLEQFSRNFGQPLSLPVSQETAERFLAMARRMRGL